MSQIVLGYHTQEFRIWADPLEHPVECITNAWIGVGYYFWVDEKFARYWGEDCKMRTGDYDIYTAHLNIDNCLDTVFNQDHYYFWKSCIEIAIDTFKKQKLEINLDAINKWLADNFWIPKNITGIIYADQPSNRPEKKRWFSRVEYVINKNINYFYYEKRIQVVIFNLKNIQNF